MFTNCSYGVYKRKVYYNQKKEREENKMKVYKTKVIVKDANGRNARPREMTYTC